jgi:hypothetical protein
MSVSVWLRSRVDDRTICCMDSLVCRLTMKLAMAQTAATKSSVAKTNWTLTLMDAFFIISPAQFFVFQSIIGAYS